MLALARYACLAFGLLFILGVPVFVFGAFSLAWQAESGHGAYGENYYLSRINSAHNCAIGAVALLILGIAMLIVRVRLGKNRNG